LLEGQLADYNLAMDKVCSDQKTAF
jgi:hypothetical protein